jgi:RNA polymerase sigma factor (sigma-70 family)
MAEELLRDDEVIAMVLAGDKDKYRLLVKKYNRRLYRICKGYLKQEAQIEDIMQEAYIKAYQHLSDFGYRARFGTWLTRIVINECLQQVRKTQRQPVLVDAEHSDYTALPEYFNPEMSSVRKELSTHIEREVEQLPENYRMVFMLREVERMSVAETADSLNISAVNVKVRLNRAREILRRTLLETYPADELYEFNLVRCARVAENVLRRI